MAVFGDPFKGGPSAPEPFAGLMVRRIGAIGGNDWRSTVLVNVSSRGRPIRLPNADNFNEGQVGITGAGNWRIVRVVQVQGQGATKLWVELTDAQFDALVRRRRNRLANVRRRLAGAAPPKRGP